jgi:hypothetical protein
MDDIATWKQILPALAANCLQSRQIFASTLHEQLFELKNEDTIENKCYPSTLCMAQSNLIRR